MGMLLATTTPPADAVGVVLPPQRHPYAAALIFTATFVLILFRRLRWLPIGRPSAAMAGAVAMVLCGVMSPEEAWRIINWDTIALLLGMMVLAEHLVLARLFERLGHLGRSFGAPLPMLVFVSACAALLSAVFVNDTICLVMTPLVLAWCREHRLRPFPYLMALATNANLGSALTLTGNPQNMIIGNASRLPYLNFLGWMTLPVAAAWLANLALLVAYYRQQLELPADAVTPPGGQGPRHQARHPGLGLFALTAVMIGFFAGFSMAFSALGGAALVIILHRHDPRRILARVDWALLLFFASLFVVIGGLETSGLAARFTAAAVAQVQGGPIQRLVTFILVTLAGSNLFSNVPFVLLLAPTVPLLPNPALYWCVLAFASTVAGNFTLFGSVANLIVAETARGQCELGFADYARFGIVSTLLTLAVGGAILPWVLPGAF